MEDQSFVVVGAEHPVAGTLYLQIIPDSEVGYSDIYQLSDWLGNADVRRSDWREHAIGKLTSSNAHSSLKWFIERIEWYQDEDEIALGTSCRTCLAKKYGLTVMELKKWADDVLRWKDIPVETKWDDSLSYREAIKGL
ncbi:hypothetical protein ACVSUC_20480 [Yersinia enterocolitica]|uniref:hypothetical protein n=1 Tax=Yersinia TaxID=629 RepID=UPI0005E26E2B|nr:MULTISPECIES: hypothetical protein [Yersinia]ELW7376326.1 hypothetical protein [Yersinia enterocolitica]MCB5319987.1 hypothetical protein [Yersinia massiliensis]CNI93529.1 Uncharacterised protein [Yersinia intermedia]HDL6777714.1 hypothetical protein [Yersinia enterocolitica]HDY4940570.1 hypothetical protein [Yersinia enterocolitica]